MIPGGKFEELAKAFTLKNLPESEVELTGEVPTDTVAGYRDIALTTIAGELDLPGFRKGHVPKDMALKKVGEIAVLEEAVELFMRDFYPELVELRKIDVVGRPHINITKLAPGNPVGLTIKVALYPEVTLPKNWKNIGAKIPAEMSLPGNDEEVIQTLESVQKNKAASAKATDGQAAPLPELNDEFARSVGAFESLQALKDQIKKGITEEKERKAKDARRGKIIDALLAEVTVAVPAIFVESELDKIMAQMRDDVARFGMSFEDYVKQMNKTEDGMRNEFREQAAKRAKLQLTLNKIANDEKVEADKTTVETEMKHGLEHFPDANPELLGIHITTVLRNEKVLQLLESEK